VLARRVVVDASHDTTAEAPCITSHHITFASHHGVEPLYQYPKLDALPAAHRMRDCWAS
jgi:hypothetical protein